MIKKTTKKLLPLALFALGISPQTTFALGLGGLDLKSYLNEPLQASIELTNLGDVEPEEIVAKIASQEVYDRAGIEKPAVLRDSQFFVDYDENKQAHLYIKSYQPVQDPFLDVLIEVSWPRGKVVRSYTLLIDLPPVAKGKKKSAAKTTARVQVKAQPRSKVSHTDKQYGPVAPNQTLWRIAQQIASHPDDVHEMVMALAIKNPHAFSGQNINMLKQGVYLDIPTDAELKQISLQQAKNFIQTPKALANNDFYFTPTETVENETIAQTQPESVSQTQASNVFVAKDVADRPLKLTSADEIVIPETKPTSTVSIAAEQRGIQVISDKLATIEQTVTAIRDNYKSVNDRIDALEAQNESILAMVQGENLPQNLATTDDEEQALAQQLSAPDVDLPLLTDDPDVLLSTPIQPENNVRNTEKDIATNANIDENANPTTKYIDQVKSFVKKVEAGVSVSPRPSVLSDIEAANAPIATATVEENTLSGRNRWTIMLLSLLGMATLAGGFIYHRRKGLGILSFLDSMMLRFNNNTEVKKDGIKADPQALSSNLDFDINQAIDAVSEEEARATKAPNIVADMAQVSQVEHNDDDEIETLEDAKIFMAYERFEQAETILKHVIAREVSNWQAVLTLLELYVLTEQYNEFEALHATIPQDFATLHPDLNDKMQILVKKVNHNSVRLKPSQMPAEHAGSLELEAMDSSEIEEPPKPEPTVLPEQPPMQSFELTEMNDEPAPAQDEVMVQEEIIVEEAPSQEQNTADSMSPKEVDDLLALIQAYVDIGEELEAQTLADKVQKFGTEAQKMRLRDIFN